MIWRTYMEYLVNGISPLPPLSRSHRLSSHFSDSLASRIENRPIPHWCRNLPRVLPSLTNMSGFSSQNAVRSLSISPTLPTICSSLWSTIHKAISRSKNAHTTPRCWYLNSWLLRTFITGRCSHSRFKWYLQRKNQAP